MRKEERKSTSASSNHYCVFQCGGTCASTALVGIKGSESYEEKNSTRCFLWPFTSPIEKVFADVTTSYRKTVTRGVGLRSYVPKETKYLQKGV